MKEEPLKELSHEAWPGYKTLFSIVLVVLTLYLIIIFFVSSEGGTGGY